MNPEPQNLSAGRCSYLFKSSIQFRILKQDNDWTIVYWFPTQALGLHRIIVNTRTNMDINNLWISMFVGKCL